MKLRTRILIITFSLVLTCLIVVILLPLSVFSGADEARLQAEQRDHLDIVEALLGDSTSGSRSPAQWHTLLGVIGARSGTEIEVIDGKGGVFAQSPRNATLNGDAGHGARQAVIVKARSGGYGSVREGTVFSSAIRLSGTYPNGLDGGFIVASSSLANPVPSGSGATFLIATGVVFFVVAVLASLLLSRQIADPVVSFVGTVNRIRDGEAAARITGTYPTELANLAAAINSMAEKLGADITKLERLERVRSEFLGNVSHELRTPIFSLQGFLETLLDGALDDPSVNRAFLQKALTHSERLNTLLNDLIEISRIESGEMKMSFRYFSIMEFLQGIIEEMEPLAVAKKIGLSLESEFDGSAKVYGDKARLRQALINLIDNAIKYTEPGGFVVCAARAAKSQCEIVIRDSGSGIPSEHLPRIFERFYRVDKDRSREVGGTGLGLAIVKHIVEAHGSVIQVSSTVGKGSVFSFKLKR